MPRSPKEMDEMMKETREKYWTELDLIEKVERMRRIVKGLLNQNEELRDTVRKLRKHRHVGEGFDIATKLDDGGGPMICRKPSDEDYF